MTFRAESFSEAALAEAVALALAVVLDDEAGEGVETVEVLHRAGAECCGEAGEEIGGLDLAPVERTAVGRGVGSWW